MCKCLRKSLHIQSSSMEACPSQKAFKKDKSHHGPAAICRSDTGSHRGIKGYTSKTQTVVFFHRQLIEKLCHLMLPILSWILFPLFFFFLKKGVCWEDLNVLLGGTTSLSSARRSGCLHQSEWFLVSSGPVRRHQGSSPCKLEKQSLLVIYGWTHVFPLHKFILSVSEVAKKRVSAH